MPSKIITTERLVIRELSLSDTVALAKLSREKSIRKTLADEVCETDKKMEENISFFIKNYFDYKKNQGRFILKSEVAYPLVFGIFLLSGTTIGHVSLSPIEPYEPYYSDNETRQLFPEIEIGYAIGEKFQNKGYATEAVKAFSTWTMSVLALPRLTGIVDSQNIASSRVLIKSNYIDVGFVTGNYYGVKNNCVRKYIFQNTK